MSESLKIIQDHEANLQIISAGILSNLQQTYKLDTINEYAKETAALKQQKLGQYKDKFAYYKQKLEGETNINTYFQAYEYILQFREFILGNLGKINYTFSIKVNDKENGSIAMKTLTIGAVDFINLIKQQGQVVGLSQSGDNLRFNTIFLNNLRGLIKSIEQHAMDVKIAPGCSSFILVNETLGTRENFTNGKLFKSKIEFLQRQVKTEKWYTFILKGTKDQSNIEDKKVFKFDIDHVEGSPYSSSIFSAIGKYFANEMTAKQELASQMQLSVDISYPNAGNLTELYILAKQRLNNKKNTFRPHPMPVAGQDLFELYKEVKANTEPFYSGGDILLEQIKSFLGSNPSLTSYKTIQQTILKFYQALNKTNIEEIKAALSTLLLQQGIEKISQEEKELSNAITNSFEQFFANMI